MFRTDAVLKKKKEKNVFEKKNHFYSLFLLYTYLCVKVHQRVH